MMGIYTLHNDRAIISEQIDQAQELLKIIENSAGQIRLKMNAKKTKCISYNYSRQVKVMTGSGQQLKVVEDFKYLGSWIDNTESDTYCRKTIARRAGNKLTMIWKCLSRSACWHQQWSL